MPTYQVYLAPVLEPFNQNQTYRPLRFHRLSDRNDDIRQSQSLPARIQRAIHPASASIPPPQQIERPRASGSSIADPTAEEDSWNKSAAGPDQRNRDEAADLFPDSASGLPKGRKRISIESQVSQVEKQHRSGIAGARRSSRLTRTSDAMLNALPGVDITESMFSLNTTATISQLSQPQLPQWTIPLSKLTSLHTLLRQPTTVRGGSERISLIVCVVTVEPTVQRQRKTPALRSSRNDALWIGGWRVIAPDERDWTQNGDALGCGVKLWEEMAVEWGDSKMRRGDVVLLEYAEFKPGNPSSREQQPSLVLSPPSSRAGVRPKVTILYRTLPRRSATRSDYVLKRGMPGHIDAPADPRLGGGDHWLPEDRALRPDLRLERSDAGVKKVAQYARWFARWIEGEPP